jgi:4-amino-4-deoxy-L-arabinose transferase-like glycosyltransferase
MFQTNKTGNLLLIAGLVIIGGAAALYIAACTTYGPWGYSDTAVYYSVARNLANGTGFGTTNVDGSLTRMTVFAPFFSIVLSLFVRPGLDLIEVNRILDILFYSILIISSGWLFFRISTSRLLGLCFALLIASTQVLAYVFSSMMSEPLAFMLGIPGFLLVILAVREDSRKHLILAGLLSGLAFFSRYAFVMIPISGVIILLILAKTTWKKRLLNTVIYSILSFGPMAIWLAIELILNHSIGTRNFAMDFDLKERIVSLITGIYEVVKYWFPYRTWMIPGVKASFLSPVLAISTLVLVLSAFIPMLRKRIPSEERSSIYLLVDGSTVFLISYFLVFFVSYVFTSDQIPITERLLSPLIPGIYMLLLSAAWSIHRVLKRKTFVPIFGLIITLFFAYFNYAFLEQYLEHSQKPSSYTAIALRGTPIFKEIDQLPEGTPIISNAHDILLFYTNRSVYYLGNGVTTSGFFIDLSDKAKINELLEEQCSVMVLIVPEIANRYENRQSPINNEDYINLQSQFQTIFQGENGVLLSAQNCIKK